MKKLALLVVLAAVTPLSLFAQGPWLPPSGELGLEPSYIFEYYNQYWIATSKENINVEVQHHTFSLNVEYGILDDLAIDASTGYVRTTSSNSDDDDAVSDSKIGLRWRLCDEYHEDLPPSVPTLTLRVGAIIEGSYFEDTLSAPGKGASGAEAALLLGKELGTHGTYIFADLGYRLLANDVPDQLLTSLGAIQRFLDDYTVSLAFRHLSSLSGKNLDNPTLTRFDISEVKEQSENVEIGVAYEDLAGHRYLLQTAYTFAGENTAERFVVGVSAYFAF